MFLLLALSTPTEDVKLDPAQPYSAKQSNTVKYEVDLTYVVTAPYHSRVLKVWLPIPPSDEVQQYKRSELSSFPLRVEPKIDTEKTYGNQFAYFEFDHPEGAQMIRHRFTIAVSELNWNIDSNKVPTVEKWPASFDVYMRSDASVTVDDRFRKLLPEIVPQQKDGATKIAAVIDWVNKEMKYDHAKASLKASSEHALTNKIGHCSDYHGLCAAFGRALGYPTRVTYGINPFPKASPSHCKLEVYLPPYGWVSFDVSETQRLIAAIKKDEKLSAEEKEKLIKAATQRLHSGFRDNTWFLQTRGTDYELVPPAKKRAPVVRTIYAEADGVALPDPDPSDTTKREWAWMTIHEYKADKVVPYPFKDVSTLTGKDR